MARYDWSWASDAKATPPAARLNDRCMSGP
jgi:hypothetical protein